VSKRVFVLLIGDKQAGETNHFQVLQERTAVEEARRLGLEAEVVMAPGFDQARMLVRRLMDRTAGPVDAVVTEPANTPTLDLMLNELRGKVGLVILSAWAESLQQAARSWGEGLPFGTVGTDHVRVGQIQGAQVRTLLPSGGRVLYVSGPLHSSAAQERMAGLKSHVGPGVEVEETAAGQWIEPDGRTAFENWYRIAKTRNPVVDVIAAGDDELAMGARRGCEALTNGEHREALLKAKFLGVDACPGYGQKLIAQGLLTASVLTPANSGLALSHLHRYWSQGIPLPLRSFTQAQAWPPGSAVQ
jgi:ABC-type sugar transport system substrate-binding protein